MIVYGKDKELTMWLRDWLDRLMGIPTVRTEHDGMITRLKPQDPLLEEHRRRQHEIRARLAAIQERQRVVTRREVQHAAAHE